MNIFLPKIKFELSPIITESRKLFSFCYPGVRPWDWSGRVYEKHPKLKEELEGVGDKKIFFKKCYLYAKNFKQKELEKLENSRMKFQRKWDKNGDKYLKILSDHFEINCPKNKKSIKTYVSIVPINPRNLDKWSFTIRYEDTEQRMMRTAIHEILHFLYFENWKEVFPKAERQTYDSPHLAWKLSEILAPIIMNHNPKIQKIVKDYSPGYKEFQNLKIGNEKLISYFETLYEKHLKKEGDFADFLKISWNDIEKNKNIF